MRQLYFICHHTETAVKAGNEASLIDISDPKDLASVNAFMTLNHLKEIIAVWDDDDAFENIIDVYTFITHDDIEGMDEVIRKIQS